MGNLFEVNGWDIDEEIKDAFPNSIDVVPEVNDKLAEKNGIRLVDFNDPIIEQLVKEGRTEEILSMCSQIIDLRPNRGIAWLNKGNCLMKFNRFPEAMKHFELAIEKESSLVEAYYKLIECQCRLKKQKEALETFDVLISKMPDDASIRLKKGLLMNGINKKLALEEYDLAIEINPLYALAFYCKGNCLVELQQRQEALKCFDTAIEIDSANLNYLLRKVVLLQELEHYKQAKEAKTKMEAIINAPSFDSSRYNMKKITEAMKMVDVMSHFISSMNNDNELELKRKIYQGDFSSFYEGTYDKKTVGVKVFSLKPNIFEEILKHCELFKSSEHNVIEVYLCEEDNKTNSIRVIGEFCEGGNLMKFFQKSNPPLKWRLQVIRQIANGVKYLIQHDIYHFNISLCKILLDKNKNIKLCDIGVKAYFINVKTEKEAAQLALIKELFIVICEVLKKPAFPSSSISLNTLEKSLIANVPENFVHLLIEMLHEEMEKNGIKYYVDYLTDQSNYSPRALLAS